MTPMLFLTLVTVCVLSCAIGTYFGYLYFKARHRESAERLEAMWEQFIEKRRTLPKSAFADQPAEKPMDNSEELRRLRLELEKRSNEYRTLKKQAEGERARLQEQIEQLNVQLAGKGDERKRIEEAAAEIQRQRDELQQAMRGIDAERRQLEAERQQIEASKREAQSGHSDLRKSLEQMKAQQADLQKTIQEMEAERAELQRSVNRLGTERTELSASRAELDRLRSELNAERERLQRQAARIDEEIMSIPEGRFTSRQEALLIKRLRQEIKYLRDELELLHAQHERAA